MYSPTGAISCAKERGAAPTANAMDTRTAHPNDAIRIRGTPAPPASERYIKVINSGPKSPENNSLWTITWRPVSILPQPKGVPEASIDAGPAAGRELTSLSGTRSPRLETLIGACSNRPQLALLRKSPTFFSDF